MERKQAVAKLKLQTKTSIRIADETRLANQRILDDYIVTARTLYAKTSIYRYERLLRAYGDFMGPQDICTASGVDISRWVSSLMKDGIGRNGRGSGVGHRTRGRGHVSVLQDLSILTAFYDYLANEELAGRNPVRWMLVKFARTNRQHFHSEDTKRRCPTLAEAQMFVQTAMDPMQKALFALAHKTGLRIGELLSLDVDHIDLAHLCIVNLPKHPKRSRYRILFDHETATVLDAWFNGRRRVLKDGERALFLGNHGKRLNGTVARDLWTRHALRLKLMKPDSPPKERLSPHTARHFFTTQMRRNRCLPEIVDELRGDEPQNKNSSGAYRKITDEELRTAYEAAVPKLLVKPGRSV